MGFNGLTVPADASGMYLGWQTITPHITWSRSMKLRTLFAGLALAGIVSSGLFAQDAPAPGGGGGGQGRGGRGGMGGFQTTKWSDFKFATAPGRSDDRGSWIRPPFEAAALAKLPADATDEAKATAAKTPAYRCAVTSPLPRRLAWPIPTADDTKLQRVPVLR